MQDPIDIFYNQNHLTEISKRGYYPEKIQLIISVLKNLSVANQLSILDVACNDGYLSQMYQRYGEVLGVDLNKQSVAACRKRGIRCLNIDIMRLSDSYHNYFDVVIAGDIVEHIFDTDKFLEKLKLLLKPNGWLILTTPNVASIGRRVMLLLGKNPFLEYSQLLPYPEFNVGHIRYYTASNLIDQLHMCQMKNIRTYGDKINLSSKISLPYGIAKYFPNLSRNLMVTCQK